MMYLYNPKGDKVSISSSQRKSLLEQGWTITLKTKSKPVVEESSVIEDKPKRGRKPSVQTSEE